MTLAMEAIIRMAARIVSTDDADTARAYSFLPRPLLHLRCHRSKHTFANL